MILCLAFCIPPDYSEDWSVFFGILNSLVFMAEWCSSTWVYGFVYLLLKGVLLSHLITQDDANFLGICFSPAFPLCFCPSSPPAFICVGPTHNSLFGLHHWSKAGSWMTWRGVLLSHWLNFNLAQSACAVSLPWASLCVSDPMSLLPCAHSSFYFFDCFQVSHAISPTVGWNPLPLLQHPEGSLWLLEPKSVQSCVCAEYTSVM